MAEPLSVQMLRKKRDRIRDTIATYEMRLREAQADLAHVIATLRLFEIDVDPADFPAYVDLNRVFRRGETTKFCMAALRTDGPLDTRELTSRIMRAKGIDEADNAGSSGVTIVDTRRIFSNEGNMISHEELRAEVDQIAAEIGIRRHLRMQYKPGLPRSPT